MKYFLGIVVCIFMITASLSVFGQKNRCSVKGRVVDEAGNPMSGANILLGPSMPPDSLDVLLADNDTTDSDGRFLVVLSVGARGVKEYGFDRLYVSYSSYPSNIATFMGSLNFRFRLMQESERYKGLFVDFKQTKCKIDVGDIVPQLFFGKAEISLRNKTDGKGFHTFEEWKYLRVEIRDEHGEIIGDSNFSIRDIENAVDLDSSKVSIALPEGRWLISFLYKGEMFSRQTILRIDRKCTVSKQIYLEMPG